MSDTTTTGPGAERAGSIFAGTMLAFAGVVNFIWGIAAIDNSSFFTDEGRYVLFDNLSTWGWFFLIVGILQFFAAVLDLQRRRVRRGLRDRLRRASTR